MLWGLRGSKAKNPRFSRENVGLAMTALSAKCSLQLEICYKRAHRYEAVLQDAHPI